MSELSAGELAAVGAALVEIAPASVRTGCRAITPADLVALRPPELVAVANAVPRRRQEFAAGRALLRSLLEVGDAIPVGPDRAPELPVGFVGSLAHCEGLAVAAVAPLEAAAALGIDVEPVRTLEADIARAILRSDEVDLDAHLAFTLKEAVYKAWSRLGGGMLDHHDVRLWLSADTFTGVVEGTGTRLEGRWTTAAGHWLALVVVPIGARRNDASLHQRGRGGGAR